MTFVPSDQYRAAVEEGARHHARSKTYSGKLMGAHVPALSELVDIFHVQSALDYGCGKGAQYADGAVERAWGFEVSKYDPCWPPYAAEPTGPFDLVICTHVLFAIPLVDLGGVVERLFNLATKAVFIAEQIGPRKKTEIADPVNRAVGWSADQWRDFIGPYADCRPDIACILSTRITDGSGFEYTREERLAQKWETVEIWKPVDSRG